MFRLFPGFHNHNIAAGSSLEQTFLGDSFGSINVFRAIPLLGKGGVMRTPDGVGTHLMDISWLSLAQDLSL